MQQFAPNVFDLIMAAAATAGILEEDRDDDSVVADADRFFNELLRLCRVWYLETPLEAETAQAA